ncbi:hypothetical protein [Muricoccus radiodurans]|uniref:hypothetical protein n=1 Tax=Muricoccus radiodurans TaxID=2231721 RepID=UPI003CE6DD55
MNGAARDGEVLSALHAGLVRRPLPETVARQLSALSVIRSDPSLLAQATAVGGARGAASSMADAWFEAVPPRRQLQKALELFADWLAENPPAEPILPTETDGDRLRAFLDHLSTAIGKEPAKNSFRDNRRSRAQRSGDARWRGHRAYNKRFRLLVRLEAKVETFGKETRLSRARLVGKAGLVAGIPFERFAASPRAAAFTAYMAARKARRSIFTNESQSPAFDTLAEALLNRCFADPATDWGLVARVYPAPAVLARMSEAEKGELLGTWLFVMRGLAEDLEQIWSRSDVDLDTMIVRRGNDSTSWNLLAQAWNTSRTAWMALLADAGQDGLLNALCPGKVMRLMAGDVAAWHAATGGSVHPDTAVWKALPKPWQVLRGEATCTAAMVAQACCAAGVKPERWLEGRVSTEAVGFEPTPELVHGVAVASPELALMLRNMRVFSGRPVRPPTKGLFARFLAHLRGA